MCIRDRKNNDLIWSLPDDLKRFKRLTSGHCIIMGRKTFDSFPGLLPNRKHIVISKKSKSYFPEEVIVVNNFKGPGVLDGQGNATKTKASSAITVKEGQSPNIKLYNDMAAAMSAVIGTRKSTG